MEVRLLEWREAAGLAGAEREWAGKVEYSVVLVVTAAQVGLGWAAAALKAAGMAEVPMAGWGRSCQPNPPDWMLPPPMGARAIDAIRIQRTGIASVVQISKLA